MSAAPNQCYYFTLWIKRSPCIKAYNVITDNTTARKSDRNISLQLFDSTTQRRLQRLQLSHKHTVRIKSSARNDHRPPWHKLKDGDATEQLQQWRRDSVWPTRFWCDVWVVKISDACFVHLLLQYTPHSVVHPNLNLVNLEATVAAKWTLAFLFRENGILMTSNLRHHYVVLCK